MQTTDNTVFGTAASTASSMASEVSKTVQGAGQLGRAATRLAAQRMHDNPWPAIGVAACLGLVVGLLTRRH